MREDRATVSVRIGVFGAPGTGKSTLVAALLQATHSPSSANCTKGTTATATATTSAVLALPADANVAEDAPHTGLLLSPERDVPSETAAPALEHTVRLALGHGAHAEVVVVDVPGALCTRDTFGETLGHVTREERLLRGDDDDDDSNDVADNPDADSTTGADSESGASLAMVCDAFVVCYDPGAPETLDAAAELLALLAAPRDPLPLRGVLCATHGDAAAADTVPPAARRRALAQGARLAAQRGLAHRTAARHDPARAAACFRAAVIEAQRAIPSSDAIATQQCCRDLVSILSCSCSCSCSSCTIS